MSVFYDVSCLSELTVDCVCLYGESDENPRMFCSRVSVVVVVFYCIINFSVFLGRICIKFYQVIKRYQHQSFPDGAFKAFKARYKLEVVNHR